MTPSIIDCHQHLIYSHLSPYSWSKGFAPVEGRSFTCEDYLEQIEGTGITQTVFMETTADDLNFEHNLVRELAARPGSIIRGLIVNAHPEDSDFDAWIDEINKPGLSGIRRICHTAPDDLSTQPRFIENIRKLGPLGLTFDLCFFARQLPLALKLVKACPGVQFILDHCGVPDIAANALDPWRADITALADEPNVACKISGVLAYCAPGDDTAEAVRPYVEHSIEAFGWDRVVWGGDWPVCNVNTTLRKWVEVSRELVAACSCDEQERLFHRNAARIYNLKD
jgi:predicted TIM-barrel fold metal-dependent hydrolase